MISRRHAYVARSLAYGGLELPAASGARPAAVDGLGERGEDVASSADFLERRIRHHLAMAGEAEDPLRMCDHIVRATAYLKLFNRLS